MECQGKGSHAEPLTYQIENRSFMDSGIEKILQEGQCSQASLAVNREYVLSDSARHRTDFVTYERGRIETRKFYPGFFFFWRGELF